MYHDTATAHTAQGDEPTKSERKDFSLQYRSHGVSGMKSRGEV